MEKKLTDKALKARRKYQRQLNKRKKKNGTLQPDRYTPEQRREYNRKYRMNGKAKEINQKYWEKKGESYE